MGLGSYGLRPRKYPPQVKVKRKNRTVFKQRSKHGVTQKFQKNSGESSENTTFQYSSNPPTHSDRNWFTQRARRKQRKLSMLCSARRNAKNCTLGKLNSPSINEWANTDEPSFQDRTQQYTRTQKEADTPLRTVSRKPSTPSWKTHL